MKKNRTAFVISAIMLLSCQTKKHTCDIANFKEISIRPVNTIVKIPPYKITDTIRYGDLTNIFDYKLQTLDSSLIVFIGVESFDNRPTTIPDINHRMSSQKEQVETGQDSMQLITETFKTIDTIKVGYLKYLDKKRNRYESRIFFNRGKKSADIWLFEKYSNKEKDKQSIIDCVLESLEIK